MAIETANGKIELRTSEIVKLAEVTGIDLKIVGQTTLIASASTDTYITEAVVVTTATNTVTVQPTISIGITPNWNEFLTSTALNAEMANNNRFQSFFQGISRNTTRFGGGTTIKLNVSVGSTATTHTATVELWGYIIP